MGFFLKYFLKNIRLLAVIFIIIRIAVPAQAEEEQRGINRVADLIETGKPDSAVVFLYDLMDSLENKNERVRALYYLSQAMGQLGRSDEEIEYLVLAYKESSGTDFTDIVNIEYSRMLFKTGSFDECIEVADEFRINYSDSPMLNEMLYTAGNAHFAKGEYRRAFNVFNEITTLGIESDVTVESIMKEGMCLYKLDFIGGAIERFEQYLAKNNHGVNTAESLYYLGNCYEITQQPELCTDIYRRLTIEYPSYPEIIETYYKLGINYLKTKLYTQARNAFSNYIANTDSSHANYNHALLNLERISFRTGEYFSEIDIYENFVRKYPKNSLSPSMLFDLAEYYRTAGRPLTAVEKYGILTFDPIYSAYSDSSAFLTADIYTANNMHEEAAEFLKKLSSEKTDPRTNQKFLLKIGSLYEDRELFDTAISWYDSSFVLQASDDISVLSLIGIGRIFKKLNRWLESGITYERILSEYTEPPYIKDVYIALSEIYFLEGRLKDSALTAEKAVKYADESEKVDILLNVAGVYEEIEQDHALQLYSIIFNNSRNSTAQKSEALTKYGDLAMQIGDNESAVNAYAEIINTDADSILVSIARKKLYGINEAPIDSIGIISE